MNDYTVKKSPGQQAYEADCQIKPQYDDGGIRKTWAELPPDAKASWETLPKVRHSAPPKHLDSN